MGAPLYFGPPKTRAGIAPSLFPESLPTRSPLAEVAKGIPCLKGLLLVSEDRIKPEVHALFC